MKKKPMVSIIIPVYNGANYVRQAIDSSLSQTYSNTEIIVVNDGSNDNGETENIALSYGNKIRYIYKPNGGVSSALNLGIQNMRGELFSWLSHDDEYYPQKIEKQVELLCEKNGKYLALCGTEFIDSEGNKIDKIWKMPEKELYSSVEILEEMNKHSLSGIALLIPKQALVDGGLFDEKLRYIQDKVLWKEIFLKGYSVIVDHETYVKSRLHGEQQTNLHRERFKDEMERTEFRFIQRYLKCGYHDLARSEWYTLLKYDINSAARQAGSLLKKEGLMNFKTRIKGFAYYMNGRTRPLIRYIYYKLKYGISSKG